MVTERTYKYMTPRPDKGQRQLYIRDTGVSASAIWRDHHVEERTPEEIAADRDIPVEAIREALEYCEIEWDVIIRDRDEARSFWENHGYSMLLQLGGSKRAEFPWRTRFII